LVAAVHGHSILASIDKLDQDQVIHGLKSMSFAEYFDLLLCAAQQVDQEEYYNSRQYQLEYVVNGCDPSQKECEALSLSASTPDIALSISDDQNSIAKKSPQVKFSDSNALYVFPQEVQKFFQNAMTTSCQIGFFNPITLDVFAFDIEGLLENGCNVVDSTDGEIICSDMVDVGKGVKQGSISFVEDYLSQGLQSLPCYPSQDLCAYAIGALVRLHKMSIIAIMHEYAYLGKDKFFHSSAPCKNQWQSAPVYPMLLL